MKYEEINVMDLFGNKIPKGVVLYLEDVHEQQKDKNNIAFFEAGTTEEGVKPTDTNSFHYVGKKFEIYKSGYNLKTGKKDGDEELNYAWIANSKSKGVIRYEVKDIDKKYLISSGELSGCMVCSLCLVDLNKSYFFHVGGWEDEYNPKDKVVDLFNCIVAALNETVTELESDLKYNKGPYRASETTDELDLKKLMKKLMSELMGELQKLLEWSANTPLGYVAIQVMYLSGEDAGERIYNKIDDQAFMEKGHICIAPYDERGCLIATHDTERHCCYFLSLYTGEVENKPELFELFQKIQYVIRYGRNGG